MVGIKQILPNYSDDESRKGSSIYLICRLVCRLFVALYRHLRLNRSRNYVVVEMRNGCRFGNQLFFISFGETLRKRYGYEVIYSTPVIKDYVYLIERIIFYHHSILLREKCSNFIDLTKETSFETFESLICNLLKEGNVCISGFYEDYRLHDRELAQLIFQPSRSIRNRINELYGDLSNTVSIHVRRGDFVNLGIHQPIDWFIDAMSKFDGDVPFLIISDDIEWCKMAFKDSPRKLIFSSSIQERDSAYIDFYLTSLCGKGNIISTSTFSWWGAYINSCKDVIQIAPYPWWNYNTEKQLYYNGLIKMGVKKVLE